MHRADMDTCVRDRGIAVMGSGMDALLHAYYLQRFGMEADVFLEDLDFPQFTPDELISSWLCLYQSTDVARTAWQGIAEFRDIALDLDAALIAPPRGTMIFERRPGYVDALEEFADRCRAKGLLVKFSTQISHLDVPPFTLAVAKFNQDISIYPKRLATQLIESILNRGGKVIKGRSIADLMPVSGPHEVEVDSEILRYSTVVICRQELQEKPNAQSADARGNWLPLRGRYLSFERASQILTKRTASVANKVTSAILDPIRGFFSKTGNHTKAKWTGAEEGSKGLKVVEVGPYSDIFHSVTGAREFAEGARSLAFYEHLEPLDLAEKRALGQPQSIPWIV